MKKRITFWLCCVCLLGFFNLQAQYVQWGFNTISGNSKVFGMDMDTAGNTYTTGHYYSGIILSETHSNEGFYIAKYDDSGNPIWSNVAGDGNARGLTIKVDANGNSLVAGYFETSITFGNGASQTTLTTTQFYPAGFIAKYDTNGLFLWAVKVGGGVNDEKIRELEVDQSGNCYALGRADGNHYLAKHSGVDGSVIWSRNDTRADDISTDGTHLYFAGTFRGTTKIDGIEIVSTDLKYNVFYGKMDNGGSTVTQLRSGEIFTTNDIRISNDTSGNVYILGSRFSEDSNFGGSALSFKNLNNIFVAKFNTSGSPAWAKQADGEGNPGPVARDIVADNYGVYITGYFHTKINFGGMVVNGVQSSVKLFKSYLAKYDSNGSNQWVKASKGISFDEPYRVATDGKGKVTISGRTGAKAVYECVELDAASQAYWGFNVRYFDATHPLAGTLPSNASQKPGAANPITGNTSVCAGQTGVTYTTNPIAQGNVIYYKWELPAGATIVSGKDTNTITVNFSSTANTGIVKVKGVSLSCESEPAQLNVQVQSGPTGTGTIAGPTQITSGATNVTYSLNGLNSINQYEWTLPTGVTSSSSTTTTANSIQLNFSNISGKGTIEVKGTNDCGESSVFTLEVTYQSFLISGKIINEQGNNVSGVNLVLSTATDQQTQVTNTGNYEFLSLSPQKYILKPERNDANLEPTVGFSDFVKLLQYNAKATSLSSYKIIAADINNDRVVNNADVFLLQRTINGIVSPTISWRFIPENYVFANPTNPFADSPKFPETLLFDPLDGEKTNQNFIAIPVGELAD